MRKFDRGCVETQTGAAMTQLLLRDPVGLKRLVLVLIFRDPAWRSDFSTASTITDTAWEALFAT
jgi:hypothetical protein